jgi:hypothetical protein
MMTLSRKDTSPSQEKDPLKHGFYVSLDCEIKAVKIRNPIFSKSRENTYIFSIYKNIFPNEVII